MKFLWSEIKKGTLKNKLHSISENCGEVAIGIEEGGGFKKSKSWGAWVAQSVKHPTLAQVMISGSVSLSPT